MVLRHIEEFENHAVITTDGNRVVVNKTPTFSEADLAYFREHSEALKRINAQLGRLSLPQLKAVENHLSQSLVADGEKD